jgi:hypothetical protein
MKMTLLEIVQSILNDLDSDFANSIDDSEEAFQIASLVKDCYREFISNRNWPHLKRLSQLESSGTTSRPNYMLIPEDVKEIELINYDCKKVGETAVQFREIKYKYPDEFLAYVHDRDADKDNVVIIQDPYGGAIPVINDKAPQYWTSFNDTEIVFDSYDSAIETTLQRSKSQIYCVINPSWTHSDSFTPDLPPEAFAGFLAECKSTASLAFKQMANQKEEQKAARQQRWLSRKAWKAKGGVRYPSYGRKS